jgi:CBS domain-containing protein
MGLVDIGRRKVVTAERETSLNDAARIMREAHVGDVVVVDQQGAHPAPVGILTDRDIVMATVAIGATPGAFNVDDVMTSSLVTVSEEDSVAKVILLMKEHGVRRIPILGAKAELAGIISIEDVISHLAEELSSLAEVSSRQYQMEIQRRRKIA